jgi:hypothetical protein
MTAAAAAPSVLLQPLAHQLGKPGLDLFGGLASAVVADLNALLQNGR